MTIDEMKDLKPGDLIRHVAGSRAYVVTRNDGGRITAVRTIDVTNPPEWEKVDGRHDADALVGLLQACAEK
jgi:hypothetical protein